MMHEITVCIVEAAMPGGLGSPKRTMGIMVGRGSRHGPRPARASALKAVWVPAMAVLALLLCAAVERVRCGPTWVVLTWGCRAGGS